MREEIRKRKLMKNYITLFILFLLGWGIIVAQESKEKVLNQLQQTIEQSATYIKAKEERIASLEKELKNKTKHTYPYQNYTRLKGCMLSRCNYYYLLISSV